MADKMILVDSSILIDFYRKTDKEKSARIALARRQYSFAISAITKYEIYLGATPNQLTFWDNVLQAITIIPFDEAAVDTTVTMNSALKKKGDKLTLQTYSLQQRQ